MSESGDHNFTFVTQNPRLQTIMPYYTKATPQLSFSSVAMNCKKLKGCNHHNLVNGQLEYLHL